MLKAIDALARAEIKLEEAKAEENTVRIRVFEKKVAMIKSQIEKNVGLEMQDD